MSGKEVQSPPSGDATVRWERLCCRFEQLIEAWAAQTACAATKEWAQQLASMSMAAQRVAGLRATLTEQENGGGDKGSDGNGEAAEKERFHWRTLTEEESEQGGADAG